MNFSEDGVIVRVEKCFQRSRNLVEWSVKHAQVRVYMCVFVCVCVYVCVCALALKRICAHVCVCVQSTGVYAFLSQ